MARNASYPSPAMVIFAGTILLAGLYLCWLFLAIPVNTEARNYLVGEGSVSAGSFFSALVYPAGANMRVVSMLVFGLTRRACDLDAPCVNAVQILELLIGLGFGMAHLRQLIQRPFIAAIAMLFWCVSPPVFAAGFWQATQHDKLAFLFSFAALTVGLRALRQPRLHHPALTTALLSGLFVLALNSKEIAFFLPVAAIAQILLFGRHDAEGRNRAAAIYGLPIAYATLYIAIYMWRLHGTWQTHVLSGDLWQNAAFYAGDLVGSHTFFWPALAPIAALLLAGIPMCLPLKRHDSPRTECEAQSCDISIGRLTLYLACIGLTSTGLAIKAQSPADYYLLVAAWAFIGWVAAMVAGALRFGRPVRYTVFICVTSLILFSVSARAVELFAPDGPWRQVQAARRLSAGYRKIRQFCTPRLTDGIKLVFHANPAGKWYFFRGGDEAPDQLVGGFICKDGQSPAMSYSFDGAAQPDRRGQLVVIWSEKLKIIRIVRDGAVLYPPASP